MFLALTFVDVECNGTNCDADHAFGVVEKLNGLGVQGKVISVLCVGDREGAMVSKAQYCTTVLRSQMTTEREREREKGRSGDKNAGQYRMYTKVKVILKC